MGTGKGSVLSTGWESCAAACSHTPAQQQGSGAYVEPAVLKTAPGFLGWWDCTQSTSPGVAEQCRAGKMHPTPPLPWEEK